MKFLFLITYFFSFICFSREAQRVTIKTEKGNQVKALHYQSSGKPKQRIVLVHGYTENYHYFDNLINEILKNDADNLIEIIAYNMPGHGQNLEKSTGAVGAGGFDDLSDDFWNAISKHAYNLDGTRKQFDVITHSMGGMSFLNWASGFENGNFKIESKLSEEAKKKRAKLYKRAFLGVPPTSFQTDFVSLSLIPKKAMNTAVLNSLGRIINTMSSQSGIKLIDQMISSSLEKALRSPLGRAGTYGLINTGNMEEGELADFLKRKSTIPDSELTISLKTILSNPDIEEYYDKNLNIRRQKVFNPATGNFEYHFFDGEIGEHKYENPFLVANSGAQSSTQYRYLPSYRSLDGWVSFEDVQLPEGKEIIIMGAEFDKLADPTQIERFVKNQRSSSVSYLEFKGVNHIDSMTGVRKVQQLSPIIKSFFAHGISNKLIDVVEQDTRFEINSNNSTLGYDNTPRIYSSKRVSFKSQAFKYCLRKTILSKTVK